MKVVTYPTDATFKQRVSFKQHKYTLLYIAIKRPVSSPPIAEWLTARAYRTVANRMLKRVYIFTYLEH